METENREGIVVKDWLAELEGLGKKYEEAHQKAMEDAEKVGQEDGKRNIPKVDDEEPPPHEKELKSQYQKQIEELYLNYRHRLDDLHDNHYKSKKEEFEQTTNAKIEDEIKELNIEKTEKIKELSEKSADKEKAIHNDSSWQTIHKKFEYAETRFEEVAKKVGRKELHVLHILHNHIWVYILILAGIGICEPPLNYQVFVSFRETPLLTLIMAGILVVSLPILAHGSGKFLKQRNEKSINYALLGISIFLVSL